MWQKNDSKVQSDKGEGAPKVKTEDRTERTVVGSSIRIKGELSGSEELLIMGQVQGAVHLKQNNVTVGQKAKIKADIFAKSIHVEGDVQGNLYGEERITLHRTATVQGNLVAPRVSLQDGARFRGEIDMDSGMVQRALGAEHPIIGPSGSKGKEAALDKLT